MEQITLAGEGVSSVEVEARVAGRLTVASVRAVCVARLTVGVAFCDVTHTRTIRAVIHRGHPGEDDGVACLSLPHGTIQISFK